MEVTTPAAGLPPGPLKLPLIGNMYNLIGALPHRALHRLALRYGPMIHLQLGELSTVVISTPDGAREVMRNHDASFASRPPILAADIMSYGCTSISFSPLTDYWRQLRKICTMELLSMKRVQTFRSVREAVFSDLIRNIASDHGSPVNITEELYSSTYDITTTIALGRKGYDNNKEKLLDVVKEGVALASGFDITDLYPSVKLLHNVSGLRKRLTTLHAMADKIFESIIHDHRVADIDESREQEDLIDVLLKYQDEAHEVPLTTENIKAVILDILAGGSETSATTVNWAMAEMLKHPRTLEKAQNEVRQVFDKQGFIDESSLLHELTYLNCVIKETLRLHPPVPLLLPRKSSETRIINGYKIPRNTKVIVNAWAINRDPEHWENPDFFFPERFLDSLVDYRGGYFEYIPFGAGRRICPGINFGLANVQLPLAMLLYHFDWKLPGNMTHDDMDMTEGLGATARRIQDLVVVPVVRRPLLPAK